MNDETEEITIRVNRKAAEAYRAIDPKRRRLTDNIIGRWIEHESASAEELLRRQSLPKPIIEEWRVEAPCDLDQPKAEMIVGKMFYVSNRTSFGINENSGLGIVDASFLRFPKDRDARATWLKGVEALHIQFDRDRKCVRVLGPASRDEARDMRVPLWIQDEETPECCGLGMSFVGQIDDNRICDQPPPGTVLWWHDTASFYVFTCPICLGVKAVGQQY